MQDEKGNGERQTARPAKNTRQDRLKLALRENLKRRKSQAKGRGDIASAPSDDAGVSLDDGSGKKPRG